MTQNLKLGVLGCGDFLRWMSNELRGSSRVQIKSLYAPKMDAVMLFVPPWIRRASSSAQLRPASTFFTKPLATAVEDAAAIVRSIDSSTIQCGVIYCRTGEATFETLRDILTAAKSAIWRCSSRTRCITMIYNQNIAHYLNETSGDRRFDLIRHTKSPAIYQESQGFFSQFGVAAARKYSRILRRSFGREGSLAAHDIDTVAPDE